MGEEIIVENVKFNFEFDIKRIKMSQKQLYEIIVKNANEIFKESESNKNTMSELLNFAESVLSSPNGKIIRTNDLSFEIELNSNAKSLHVDVLDYNIKLINLHQMESTKAKSSSRTKTISKNKDRSTNNKSSTNKNLKTKKENDGK